MRLTRILTEDEEKQVKEAIYESKKEILSLKEVKNLIVNKHGGNEDRVLVFTKNHEENLRYYEKILELNEEIKKEKKS